MNYDNKIEINPIETHLAVPEVYLEDGTGNVKTRFRDKCQDEPDNVVDKENFNKSTSLLIAGSSKDSKTFTKESPVVSTDVENLKDFKGKCNWFFKKLILFSVSHVGLTCIVVGYSILGAVLFQYLEAWHEERSRKVISQIREKRRQEIWNITKSLNIFHEGNWSIKAAEILVRFQKDIFIITKELGWDGINDVAEGELYWSFPGALLYSVTVITTIGYGHITPKTREGRIATMFYALLGIPLTLLCLANIGRTMGKGFRVLYNRLLIKFFERRKKILSFTTSKVPFHYTNGDAFTAHGEKHDTMGNNTEKDIGTGNEKPEVQLTELTVIVSPLRNQIRNSREVPVSLCLVMVVCYNLLGSLIFGLWEKQWGFLTGIYFCFITLSTIGFGDIVPGHSLESWQSHEKQVICTLYLLFGLALIAMCFDLIQTQVRNIARNLAEKLGLLEKDHDESSLAELTNIATGMSDDDLSSM